MKEKNMTALVSCFVRSYHYKNNPYRVFSDHIAEKILSSEEYCSIADNISNGITFFNPSFVGTKEEALKWIVDNQLSPSVLGRSAFCENSLFNAIQFGCKQYLIFASGYDTFACRNHIKNLKVFEIDRSEMIVDKMRRLENSKLEYSAINFIECDFTCDNWIDAITSSSYDKNQISFSSLLGISYYLMKEEIQKISNIVCNGSSIVFDYPTYEESKETQMNETLARGAGEEMKSKYSYQEIENILSENGFLIYEHLNDNEMTHSYFDDYNTLNPNHKIIAPKGVSYCLAVEMQ